MNVLYINYSFWLIDYKHIAYSNKRFKNLSLKKSRFKAKRNDKHEFKGKTD